MSSLRARTSSTAETRKVTSSVHQGRDCQPCILCKKGNQSKYFHPKSWKDDTLLQSLRDHEPSLNIQPESCICWPCRNDVSHISEDGFIPRWRKQTNKGSIECCVPNCTNNVYKVTKLVDKISVCNFLVGKMKMSVFSLSREQVGRESAYARNIMGHGTDTNIPSRVSVGLATRI